MSLRSQQSARDALTFAVCVGDNDLTDLRSAVEAEEGVGEIEKRLAWHERMAAEYAAAGKEFSAGEHRAWAEEAARQATVVKASLYLSQAA